jgi:hypothetical protein
MKFYYFLAAVYLVFPMLGLVQMKICTPAGDDAGIALAEPPPAIAGGWDCYLAGRELLKWSLWSIAFAVLGAFLFMGLPGALLIGVYSLTGIIRDKMEGDQMWPAAILASFLWPLGIPFGLLVQQLGTWAGWNLLYSHGLVSGLLIWGVSTGLILRAMQ